MGISRHNRRISEFCNKIIGDSWLGSQIPDTDGRQYPILQYDIEDMYHYTMKEVNTLRQTPIPGHDPMIDEDRTTLKPTAELGPHSFGARTEYFRGAVDHEAVKKILSSPLFNAYSLDSGIQSSGDASAVAKICERLAQGRPSSKDSAELAEELFKRTTSDEWLHHYIQTEDFDGTSVALICGFYQSLYLYYTQIVEKHRLSRSRDNHPLASNQKTVVLLLRLQHLQTFQRTVTYKLTLAPLPRVFELLGSEGFLYSCLIDSLEETMNDLRNWEINMSFLNRRTMDDHPSSKSLLCLIHFLPRLLHTEDDEWLWKHLHSLDETSDRDNCSPTIIASLYQGLYLYGKDENHTKTKEMAEGRLAALFFRSHHLKYIEDTLSPRMSLLFDEKLFLESSKHTIGIVRTACEFFLLGRSHELSLSKKEKKEAYGNEDSSSSRESINIFLGTKFLQGFQNFSTVIEESIDHFSTMIEESIHHFSTMIEESIDLKKVHALGGLICTIEGESSTSLSGDDLACTSWCILRHPATNLFFCVDLKKDAYENKILTLDGESTIDYEGAIEVEITDGNTFVRSLESDGSSFNGCLKDFVYLSRDKEAPPSCAEVALRNLPQSDCLKEANLNCSALHMLALAVSARNKDYLTLMWGGGARHIEYSTGFNGQDEGPSDQAQYSTDVALRKCALGYTNAGKLVGEDIIWEGPGSQRSTDPQDRNPRRISVHGENKEEATNEEEVTEEERGKVDIIFEQSKLWSRRWLSENYSTMHKDRIRESLKKASKEVEEGLVSFEEASAAAQFKQNRGVGIGATFLGFGGQLQGNGEYRPRAANMTIKRFLDESTMVKPHLKSTVVVPRDLHTDDFNELKERLTSGRITERSEDFFIVKAEGSCSLQVFLCNPEDPSRPFVWLTDLVLPNASDAEKVFSDKLNGKTLSISRTDSVLHNVLAQNFKTRFARKILRSRQVPRQVPLTEKFMILCSELPFPRPSDSWIHIIGDQSKYNGGNYFFKATEYLAIVCSATLYTTGGAIVRLKKEIEDESQTSTSFNSRAYEQKKWLFHGCCKKVCTSKFEIGTDRVIITGKFSKFKGISRWPEVHWGTGNIDLPSLEYWS